MYSKKSSSKYPGKGDFTFVDGIKASIDLVHEKEKLGTLEIYFSYEEIEGTISKFNVSQLTVSMLLLLSLIILLLISVENSVVLTFKVGSNNTAEIN